MLPEKKLHMVHLQLTRNCNLRCWFCGQWGNNGFFSDHSGKELSYPEWCNVINSLVSYRDATGISPVVMLWGGEPLTSPYFNSMVTYLRKHNFDLGIVTNGTMIDKYSEVLRKEFKKIYISVDGPPEIHDSIRGKGVFDKLVSNIKLLQNGNAKIIIMTVISPALLKFLPDLPETFKIFNPDMVLLQEMITLSESEIKEYKLWLNSCFGMEAKEIDSWQIDLPPDFEQNKKKALEKVLAKESSFPFVYLPHGAVVQKFCTSPFYHVHVTWNGDVTYCTDFYDFKAGNVKNNDLIDIFNNELSDTFRQEIIKNKCSICNHCSWRQKGTYLNCQETD
jgi:MoaA/NifB/PqqE/SkfB family radical SAM enzyme